MKKIAYIIIGLILVNFSYARAQQVVFHKIYTGIPGEIWNLKFSSIQTDDSGYLTGNRESLIKLDSNGTQTWRKYLAYSNPNLVIVISTIHKKFVNGYFATGANAIISLDSTYNIEWVKEFNSNEGFMLYSTIEINPNEFLFSGGIGHNGGDYPFVMKTDSTGTILWSKYYSTTTTPHLESIGSMVQTLDGGFIACANSQSILYSGAYSDGTIFKIDSSGNVIWSRRFNTPDSSSTTTCNSITASSDSTYLISGYKNLQSYLMNIDGSGNILWEKKYLSGTVFISRSVVQTNDGGYAFSGTQTDASISGSTNTGLLVKTDSLGFVEWGKKLGGYEEVWPSNLMQTNDNGYMVSCRRVFGGDFVFNAIKTDSLGNTDSCLNENTFVNSYDVLDTLIDFILIDSVTSVQAIPYSYNFPSIGTELDYCEYLSIKQQEKESPMILFPNPNNGIFTIDVKSNAKGSIEILDIKGKLIDKYYFVNQNKICLDLRMKCLSGIYFVKIVSENTVCINKIIIN